MDIVLVNAFGIMLVDSLSIGLDDVLGFFLDI